MLDVEKYMELALSEAQMSKNDIPVGCVLVDSKGNILSKNHNRKEESNDVTSHAEILCLREASKKLDNWRLNDCSMFITLEPCPMCAWAIINSRIKNVYFGAYDSLYGAMSSKIDMKTIGNSNINIAGGIKEEECNKILREYFKKIR